MSPTRSTPERGTVPHPDAERFHAGREEEEEGKRKSVQVIHEPHLPRATTAPVDNPATATDQVMDGQHDDQPLFCGYEPPEREELSADQRRTRRQAEHIRQGIHPLTLAYTLIRPLHPDADRTRTADSPQDGTPTCGICAFRTTGGGYPKCAEPNAPRSHGPATDVRAWWPACTRWTPKAGA